MGPREPWQFLASNKIVAKMAKMAQVGPRQSQDGSKCRQYGPRCSQKGSGIPEKGSKMHPWQEFSGPVGHKIDIPWVHVILISIYTSLIA